MSAGLLPRRALSWLRRPRAIPAKLRRTLRLRRAEPRYRAALERGELVVEAGPAPPGGLITVAMPVHRVREDHLRAAIASVLVQTWPDWELVAVDDASPEPHVARVLAEAARDPRVRVVRRGDNGGVSAASNDAVAQARGAFVAFLDHDDALHPRALELAARFLAAHPGTDWLYTDEDKLDARGRHREPMLKPGWSRHLLLALNVASHLRVVRRAAIERAGGHRRGFEGAQDWDLALRVLAAGGRFAHLPCPLYHWRASAGSMARFAAAKPEANARAAAALAEHARTFPLGGATTVESVIGAASLFRVRRAPPPGLTVAAVSDPSPAAVVEAARASRDEVVAWLPPGVRDDRRDELLALLMVPGTALAAGRAVAGRTVRASGWVLGEDGEAYDPWAGLAAADPGYLNLALAPGRRVVPPSSGWVARRETLVAAWDAAPEVGGGWRLAAGLARLGLEAVTTPTVSLRAARGATRPPGGAPSELPRERIATLARLGL